MIVDYQTRWPECFPTKKKDAKTAATIIRKEICSRYMMPKKILSDRDPAFIGNVMKELMNLYGIKKVNTTAYHAQANGLTERTNKTAVQVMKGLILQYQRQ